MDFSKIGQAAAVSDDLTQDSAGFEREVPREGVAFLRLRDYWETGRHQGANKKYKPNLKTILVFELSHPDHLIEIDDKKVPQTLFIRLNKGATSASGYKKLFNAMNRACGGGMQHFAQMLGRSFLGEVYHNADKADPKKIYANLDLEGAWSLKAPMFHDPIQNTDTKVPIMELSKPATCFLWENESIEDADVLEMWESIYIEGTRTVQDPKTKEDVEKSKNWLQELIMKNLEWEGSTTQALTQDDISLEELEEPHAGEPVAQGALADAAMPSLDD